LRLEDAASLLIASILIAQRREGKAANGGLDPVSVLIYCLFSKLASSNEKEKKCYQNEQTLSAPV
jgi:hypothetical protein